MKLKKWLNYYHFTKNVLVNDKIVKDNYILKDNDIIKVNGNEYIFKENIYIILNKKAGYVSAIKDNLYPSILELIDDPYLKDNLKIAGRLDLDTEGLIILTNDGEMIHLLTSPKKRIQKKYYVEAKEKIVLKDEIIINDDGENIRVYPKIDIIDDYHMYITLTEGKYHEVKKILFALDNEVLYLKRVQIGKINLDGLNIGEYKKIEKEELIRMLNE